MSEKKKNLAAQASHEDEMLNRTLLWICGAAVLLLFLLFINRYGFHYRISELSLAVVIIKYLIPAVTALAAVGCVAGLLLFKKSEKKKLPAALTLFCGGLTLCSASALFFQGTGVQFMCAVVPAAAILALVYYLFQREFFLIALVSGIGIASLWVIRRAAEGHTAIMYITLVVAVILFAAVALFCRKVQAAGGVWKNVQLFAKNAAFIMVYATCVIMAALLLAAALVGSGIAYYLLFPAVGWVIIMAVYFTVKLM